MTTAFMDQQTTGPGPVRRPSRTHAAMCGQSTMLRGATGSTLSVVHAIRPAVDQDVLVAPVTSGTRPGYGRPAIRLTRRGRLVFGALLVLIALVVFSLGRFTAGADASAPPQRVTVAAGDTLWSIAEQASPRSDPRDVVDRIVAANHLATSALVPGSVLVIPRG